MLSGTDDEGRARDHVRASTDSARIIDAPTVKIDGHGAPVQELRVLAVSGEGVVHDFVNDKRGARERDGEGFSEQVVRRIPVARQPYDRDDGSVAIGQIAEGRFYRERLSRLKRAIRDRGSEERSEEHTSELQSHS